MRSSVRPWARLLPAGLALAGMLSVGVQAADPAAEPPAPDPILGQMRGLIAAALYDETVREGQQWLKTHPKDVETQLGIARLLTGAAVPLKTAGNGMLQVAYNCLQAARAAAPDRRDIRVALCDVLFHLRKSDALIEEVRSFLQTS